MTTPTPLAPTCGHSPALSLPAGSLPSNRDRWKALGKPEVICPHCWHIGPDKGPHRVCEKCEEREPEGDEHGQHCDACDSEVWWIPECPECQRGMEWTYGEIREEDYARVQANDLISHARTADDHSNPPRNSGS